MQARQKAEAEQLNAQVAALAAALENEQAARLAVEREARDKAERLEQLEGTA
jgi:hypothetical protein